MQKTARYLEYSAVCTKLYAEWGLVGEKFEPLALSTIQKFSGWPLKIKRPGASNSSVNCGRYSPKVFYFSPRPAVSPKNKTKKHGYGRVTAQRYY